MADEEVTGPRLASDGLPWLARITDPMWGGGALLLRRDYTWEAVGDDPALKAALALARLAAVGYRYSPAHGQRGSLLAHRVSQALEGSAVELPPQPPPRPGAVY